MNNKKTFKIVIVLGIIILIVLSLGTIGYMYTKAKTLDTVFANNVYIEDLAVGGLTKEEAKAKLEQDITDETSKQKIVFTQGEISNEVPLSDLGITYNINEIIDEAFKIGQDNGLFEKYQIAKNGLAEDKVFELSLKVSEEKIEEALNACADKFYVKPVNATLKRVNGQFVTTKEVVGQSLDVAATKTKTLELLNDFDFFTGETSNIEPLKIEVVTKTIAPECTEATLQDVQNLVASFSTSYNGASANREANLKVAANKVTTMLYADQVFKLSNYLEPFTEAAGYRNAGVIVNGKIEDGLGGGICQVASTLYNSVLLTDLEIVSRRNHSLAVSYVPLGRDATYATDAIDFQFKNNSGYPIYIEAYCANDKVIVNIYGHNSLKSEYDIKFASELIETIPAPATVYEDDPTLDEGKQVTQVSALDGKRVKLYKIYYKNGVEVNRVLVNTSYYKPRAAVVKRGTKKAPVVQTPEQVVKPDLEEAPTVGEIPNVESNQMANVDTPSPQNDTTSIDDTGFAVVQQ